MAHIICYHDSLFFEWSTICDAPRTYGITREEYEEFYRDQYGQTAMEFLPERLERAINNGTSSFHYTLEQLIRSNRAGPKEERLTFEEVINLIKNGECQ